MKKIIFAALAAAVVALPSCSSDESQEVAKGNEIHFNVTAGKSSRGGTATTTATLSQFKIYASVEGQTENWFFNGLTVNKGAEGWNYGYTRFWPETKVDFFSFAPATVNVNATTVGSMGIDNYVVGTNAAEDLLYAYNKGEQKKSDAVQINFRHALSQIVFVASNSNANYKFELTGIKLPGLINSGKFDWPTASTYDPNYSEGELGNDEDTEKGASWGTWTLTNETTDYVADITSYNSETAGINNEVAVTTSSQALFLMPQPIVAWEPKAGNQGKSILLTVKVTDIASGVVVYNGNARVALSAPDNKWKQGKKYIYHLNFGEGTGFEPDPAPGKDPQPVLVKISVDVTVDEFQNGGTQTPPVTK